MSPGRPTPSPSSPRPSSGFSIIELMVAIALGLLLTVAMVSIYASTKVTFARQQQLSALQQSVRVAFDYLGDDLRSAGNLGCYTGLATSASTTFTVDPAVVQSDYAIAPGFYDNFGSGIEGAEFSNANAGALTLTSSTPPNVTTGWATNLDGVLPNLMQAFDGNGQGALSGSDILVVRGAAGAPVRLAADTVAGAAQVSVENTAGAACLDGSASLSGLCAHTPVLIASCSTARVFNVASIAGSTLNLTAPFTLGSDPVYTTASTELFPLSTIVYYLQSSGGQPTLMRYVSNGTNVSGQHQPLLEGVENLQVLYGIDTSPPTKVVAQYVTADKVADWSSVLAVRIGLLVRSTVPVEGDLANSLPTSAVVNGVTVTFPTSGPKYDRRVFTTTVALRNKVAYP